jgi:lipoprotein NlpD
MRWCLVLSFLLLSGCFGGGHYAPVIERKQRLEAVPKFHTVDRGDTLYSIAWLYSMDFRGLASTNAIGFPYTIYPGQRIRLHGRSASLGNKGSANAKSQVAVAVVSSGQAVAPALSKTAEASVAKPVTTRQSGYPFRWQWPATKKITRPYSSASSVHKGIDIQGNFGEPVRAANSGKVVYAGSGLVGFGNLLIIKHNERYLSAYGHNSKLVVAEGAQVKAGQKIAEFGDSGTDKVKLHFEIRRDGKPINPLSLLPKNR